MKNKITVFILSLIFLGMFSVSSFSDEHRTRRRIKINCKKIVKAKERRLKRRCESKSNRRACVNRGREKLREMHSECRRCNNKYKSKRAKAERKCMNASNRSKCKKNRMKSVRKNYKRCLKRAKIIRIRKTG